MRLPQEILETLIERILGVCTPERIIVFGSAAADQMTEESDVDILVLTSEDRPLRQIRSSIRLAFLGVPVPVDLVVMRPKRYEATKNVVGGLAYPVARSGKVVYEAA